MTVTVPVPIPVISVVPAIVIEHIPSAEIPSMLTVEPVAVVFVISTVAVVATPGGVSVIGVAGEGAFGDAELGFYTYLGISGICYQAAGYDQGEDK
jgi:hypothetical protein